jgi:hypothetical protein
VYKNASGSRYARIPLRFKLQKELPLSKPAPKIKSEKSAFQRALESAFKARSAALKPRPKPTKKQKYKPPKKSRATHAKRLARWKGARAMPD